jgi:hypothetical protein
MKKIQRIVGSLLSYDDVNQVTVKKVEDSKVEIFEGEKYVGRFSYEKTEPLRDLLRENSILTEEIQNMTIGLFRPYGSTVVEMVISREDFGGLHIISPALFGGFSETYIPENKGIYAPFEPGVNLTQMMKSPIEFNDFFNSHFKK